MPSSENNPRIYQLPRSPLRQELSAFLIDRQARNLSPRTIDYCVEKLGHFREFVQSVGITDVRGITPQILRHYLLHLRETHNPGGVHGHFRAVKAFLRWWGAEVEPENWTNPLSKVAAPKVADEPLPPVNLEDLRGMLKTCKRKTYSGDRDKAILLFLLDTGVRRSEMCGLNLGDVNLRTGSIMVRRGKGGKSRLVFAGARTRRALTAYLRHRPDGRDAQPLWAARTGGRLSPNGLREVLRRRARRAGVPIPSVHAFRRGFALLSLTAGVRPLQLAAADGAFQPERAGPLPSPN